MIFVLQLIIFIKLPTFAIGEDCIEDVSRTVLNISEMGDIDSGGRHLQNVSAIENSINFVSDTRTKDTIILHFFCIAANIFCKNIKIESKTDHSLLPKVVNDSLGCYYLIGSNNDTLTNTVRPIYTRLGGNNSRFLHQCNDNNDMIWRGTVIFSSVFFQ